MLGPVSGFTHTNLRQDVPDSSEGSDREGSIEARLGRSALGAEQIGLSFFRYGPGFRAPIGHHHREQEEAYVVVAGSGRMKLDDEVIELRQWDAIRVAPEVVRAFEGGPEGLDLIAVGGPKPEGGDGEAAGPDFWPAD
jgi:mannose-6-phosphate isomerase-like protein (cupin superfamily)